MENYRKYCELGQKLLDEKLSIEEMEQVLHIMQQLKLETIREN